jgi:hypothetical protein
MYNMHIPCSIDQYSQTWTLKLSPNFLGYLQLDIILPAPTRSCKQGTLTEREGQYS